MLAEIDRAGLDVSKMTPEELASFMGAPERASSPAMVKIQRDIQEIAERFDNATIKVADIERLADDLKELAPDLVEGARAARAANRESGKELTKMLRKAAERQSFADIPRQELESAADEVIDNILGQSPGRTMMPGDFAVGPRGPLKERALASLPTSKVLDFVERDIQRIDTHYVRTMATDIALTKKFGSVDMLDQIQKINDEANAKIAAAKSEKEAKRLDKVRNSDIRDLLAMRDRIRGTYALPDNPDGLLHRGVHTGKTLNYMASLGMMTVSAISDLAKPVMVHGLTRTMGTAIAPFTHGLKAIKLAKKDVKLAGQGLDLITNDRVATFADVVDTYAHGTVVERGVDRAGRLFSFAALMAPWNAVVKQFSGIVTQTRVLQACEDWVAGRISQKDKTFLASNGIDANMAERIHRQFAGGKQTKVVQGAEQADDASPIGEGAGPTKGSIAPDELTFREGHQERTSQVEDIREEEGYYEPIVTIARDGQHEILDGHNRAVVARERGDRLPYVEISASDYQRIADAGFDDMEIAYAALSEAGEDSAASALNRQFPGARVAERGTEAQALFEYAEAAQPASTPQPRIETVDIPGHGGKDGAVWWANTADWTDKQAVQALRSAVNREVDNIIVTPGVADKPLWASTQTGQIIAQFQSFAMASVQRTMVAGLQQRDMAVLNGVMLAMGLGMLQYYLKSELNGQEPSDKPGVWIYEAFDNAGLGGWLMNANHSLEKITGDRLGLSALTGQPARRYINVNKLGAIFGPSVGRVSDLIDIFDAMSGGGMTQSDVRKIRRMIPLQNVFYLKWLFDQMESGVNEAFGIPKRTAA
jgi:hypothetical protein